jgi:hypothetical protein
MGSIPDGAIARLLASAHLAGSSVDKDRQAL